MFDLNDSTGEITIDFDETAEDGSVSATKVVVAPPRTFGSLKRLRAEVEKINGDRDALATQYRDDPAIGATEMISKLNNFIEDAIMRWWRLVMTGDESYKGQASPPPPDDIDAWPLYLATAEAMNLALQHWKTVPLARGGTLAQTPK